MAASRGRRRERRFVIAVRIRKPRSTSPCRRNRAATTRGAAKCYRPAVKTEQPRPVALTFRAAYSVTLLTTGAGAGVGRDARRVRADCSGRASDAAAATVAGVGRNVDGHALEVTTIGATLVGRAAGDPRRAIAEAVALRAGTDTTSKATAATVVRVAHEVGVRAAPGIGRSVARRRSRRAAVSADARPVGLRGRVRRSVTSKKECCNARQRAARCAAVAMRRGQRRGQRRGRPHDGSRLARRRHSRRIRPRRQRGIVDVPNPDALSRPRHRVSASVATRHPCLSELGEREDVPVGILEPGHAGSARRLPNALLVLVHADEHLEGHAACPQCFDRVVDA